NAAASSTNRQSDQNARIETPKLLFDGRLFDEVEPAEIPIKIRVAFHLDAALVGATTTRRALAVFGVELIDHVHSGADASERRKSTAVKIGVVGKVDEHLAGARVRPGHRVGDIAALVALLDRIVWDACLAPWRRYFWIAIDAELHHEAGYHTEETDVIVE